jgi:hypothetical protein
VVEQRIHMIWDFDFDLNFLRSAVDLVDSSLEHLDEETGASPDPDQFGIFDEIEYICGFGFVACQTYMTSVISQFNTEKRKALAFGPKHKTGQPIVQIVNAAANYWKHSPEWSLDAPTTQAKQTLEVIASLGINTNIGSYPVSNTLGKILVPNPPRFVNLIPFLTQWREALPRQNRI